MSKKSKPARTKTTRTKLRAMRKPREKYSEETPRAEWMTIGWLLAAMTTLAAEVAGVLTYALSGDSPVAGVFSRYMFFSAMVIGAIAGLLTLAVYKFRTTAPPRAVTIFVLIIALAPVPLWAWLFGF